MTNPIVMPNDFTNFYLPTNLYGNPYVLTGDSYEQAPTVASIYGLGDEELPDSFPMRQWQDQASRYYLYWLWFDGQFINQSKQGEDGETQFRFPLRINNLRNIARKHSSVLFGEVPDGPNSMVETNVKARNSLTGKKPDDSTISFAALCENIIQEVWNQSKGRALQQEAGELTQFLGGHVFQVAYESWRKDLLVPITIRSWKADLFLPVWSNGDYWDLTEAYVVCRIEGAVAKKQFGVDTNAVFVTYVETWNKDEYSIYIDGKPIVLDVNGLETEFHHLPNPFGFVPFVYIPHLREGGFYGSSHIPDIVGLEQEYNAAMANLGDAVQNSVQRERYMRNTSQVTDKELPNGKHATNLGMQNPAIKDPPHVWTEDPPNLSQGLVNYPKEVYEQLRRSAFIPAVAEGEDEGSQRSGVTLDIRFWPLTSHARAERSYWETGLDLIAKYILQIVNVKKLWKNYDPSIKTESDFLNKLAISQNWYPQIPRDRESVINEAVTRLGGNAMSLELAMKKFGDVENPDEEKALIEDRAKFIASLNAPPDPDGSNQPLTESRYAKNNASLEK